MGLGNGKGIEASAIQQRCLIASFAVNKACQARSCDTKKQASAGSSVKDTRSFMYPLAQQSTQTRRCMLKIKSERSGVGDRVL